MAGAREPLAKMFDWAEARWHWHNVITQMMVTRYFNRTGLLTRLPDAYNYKPYWCDLRLSVHRWSFLK